MSQRDTLQMNQRDTHNVSQHNACHTEQDIACLTEQDKACHANHDRAHYQAFMNERRVDIMQRIEQAAAQAGRDARSILVEAVSKTVDIEEVICARRAGWEVFAENRPQELVRKVHAARAIDELAKLRFDMIGNLQKNKINHVLGAAVLIHSISSLHLAEAVSRRACVRGFCQPVLLEINVSGEQSKSGFSPEAVQEAAEYLAQLEGIDIRGLMTMAPAHSLDAARRSFAGLRELRDVLRLRMGLPLDELSCGMSDDFLEAIAEGSTIVRLGRVVFSPEYVLG